MHKNAFTPEKSVKIEAGDSHSTVLSYAFFLCRPPIQECTWLNGAHQKSAGLKTFSQILQSSFASTIGQFSISHWRVRKLGHENDALIVV
jgi:hypothetical protein